MLRDRGLCVLACIAFLVAGACGGWSQNPPAAKFALEVSDPRGGPPYHQMIYPGGGESVSTISWSQPGQIQNPTEPSALSLKCKVEGDAVVVTAAVLLGPWDPQMPPPTREGMPVKQIGTYTLRLNESAVLKPMEQYGLKPITIRLVSAQPTPSERPAVVSRVPSIQITIVDEDWNVYKLALRNMSARAVTSLDVERDTSGGQQEVGNGTLIAPGATYQMSVGRERRGKITPAGYVADTPPSIVLRAALFADGTYEGDPATAADLTARIRAGDLEHARVAEVVSRIMADQASDDATKAARIREEVSRISQTVDPAFAEEIRSKFPDVSDVSKVVERASTVAMANEKESVLRSLAEYDLNRSRPGRSRPPTLADWYRLWLHHMSFGIPSPAPTSAQPQ